MAFKIVGSHAARQPHVIYQFIVGYHACVERAQGNLVRGVDKPIAELISDLNQRGLLESTIIVGSGEFGRTPDNGVRGGTACGRDHNPNAMTIWFAGEGCNASHTIGATDELGVAAVEGKAHVRDFHVTLLRLLGLDDNKLTLYHTERFKQLSQFGGTVVKNLIALPRSNPLERRAPAPL